MQKETVLEAELASAKRKSNLTPLIIAVKLHQRNKNQLEKIRTLLKNSSPLEKDDTALLSLYTFANQHNLLDVIAVLVEYYLNNHCYPDAIEILYYLLPQKRNDIINQLLNINRTLLSSLFKIIISKQDIFNYYYLLSKLSQTEWHNIKSLCVNYIAQVNNREWSVPLLDESSARHDPKTYIEVMLNELAYGAMPSLNTSFNTTLEHLNDVEWQTLEPDMRQVTSSFMRLAIIQQAIKRNLRQLVLDLMLQEPKLASLNLKEITQDEIYFDYQKLALACQDNVIQPIYEILLKDVCLDLSHYALYRLYTLVLNHSPKPYIAGLVFLAIINHDAIHIIRVNNFYKGIDFTTKDLKGNNLSKIVIAKNNLNLMTFALRALINIPDYQQCKLLLSKVRVDQFNQLKQQIPEMVLKIVSIASYNNDKSMIQHVNYLKSKEIIDIINVLENNNNYKAISILVDVIIDEAIKHKKIDNLLAIVAYDAYLVTLDQHQTTEILKIIKLNPTSSPSPWFLSLALCRGGFYGELLELQSILQVHQLAIHDEDGNSLSSIAIAEQHQDIINFLFALSFNKRNPEEIHYNLLNNAKNFTVDQVQLIEKQLKQDRTYLNNVLKLSSDLADILLQKAILRIFEMNPEHLKESVDIFNLGIWSGSQEFIKILLPYIPLRFEYFEQTLFSPLGSDLQCLIDHFLNNNPNFYYQMDSLCREKYRTKFRALVKQFNFTPRVRFEYFADQRWRSFISAPFFKSWGLSLNEIQYLPPNASQILLNENGLMTYYIQQLLLEASTPRQINNSPQHFVKPNLAIKLFAQRITTDELSQTKADQNLNCEPLLTPQDDKDRNKASRLKTENSFKAIENNNDNCNDSIDDLSSYVNHISENLFLNPFKTLSVIEQINYLARLITETDSPQACSVDYNEAEKILTFHFNITISHRTENSIHHAQAPIIPHTLGANYFLNKDSHHFHQLQNVLSNYRIKLGVAKHENKPTDHDAFNTLEEIRDKLLLRELQTLFLCCMNKSFYPEQIFSLSQGITDSSNLLKDYDDLSISKVTITNNIINIEFNLNNYPKMMQEYLNDYLGIVSHISVNDKTPSDYFGYHLFLQIKQTKKLNMNYLMSTLLLSLENLRCNYHGTLVFDKSGNVALASRWNPQTKISLGFAGAGGHCADAYQLNLSVIKELESEFGLEPKNKNEILNKITTFKIAKDVAVCGVSLSELQLTKQAQAFCKKTGLPFQPDAAEFDPHSAQFFSFAKIRELGLPLRNIDSLEYYLEYCEQECKILIARYLELSGINITINRLCKVYIEEPNNLKRIPDGEFGVITVKGINQEVVAHFLQSVIEDETSKSHNEHYNIQISSDEKSIKFYNVNPQQFIILLQTLQISQNRATKLHALRKNRLLMPVLYSTSSLLIDYFKSYEANNLYNNVYFNHKRFTKEEQVYQWLEWSLLLNAKEAMLWIRNKFPINKNEVLLSIKYKNIRLFKLLLHMGCVDLRIDHGIFSFYMIKQFNESYIDNSLLEIVSSFINEHFKEINTFDDQFDWYTNKTLLSEVLMSDNVNKMAKLLSSPEFTLGYHDNLRYQTLKYILEHRELLQLIRANKKLTEFLTNPLIADKDGVHQKMAILLGSQSQQSVAECGILMRAMYQQPIAAFAELLVDEEVMEIAVKNSNNNQINDLVNYISSHKQLSEIVQNYKNLELRKQLSTTMMVLINAVSDFWSSARGNNNNHVQESVNHGNRSSLNTSSRSHRNT